eukprot:CAMPEP_0172472072 /NCGR_PEP_ID=MMETSP1065-20121228/68139_1 /TAXON_ID=265537 /ORGANISM="Amphiprora paludosa, Strain CCMP125" /LENGTH=347 /DNA_ID=CAMNT_0013230193 /DNA_START=3585 /DNA_END=4628 /DNA_ORIENTATION=+
MLGLSEEVDNERIGTTALNSQSALQECYPYLARRLFTDRSPRAKKALRAMLGLSEEVDNERIGTTALNSQSALAVVQAGANVGQEEEEKSGGALSPRKLLELSDGFASYTPATADVDRDGAGQTAAVTEFAKLLLDPKGSTLQDILVEESARLGDAATRKLLQASLIDSAPAKRVNNLLQAQKQFVDQNPLLSNLIPQPLKTVFIDRPAQVPELVESLLALSREDEKILQTATELAQALSSRMNGQEPESDFAMAERISSPSASSLDTEAIRALLANEETRQFLVEQAPGAAALGRRLGAGLLRRAAYRTDQTDALPENARQSLAELNRRLAQTVDVADSSNDPNDF